jgi:hypothetical protein
MVDKLTYYKVILEEIDTLRTMLRPEDTGHIHTAIRVLESRLYYIKEEMRAKTPLRSETLLDEEIK